MIVCSCAILVSDFLPFLRLTMKGTANKIMHAIDSPLHIHDRVAMISEARG